LRESLRNNCLPQVHRVPHPLELNPVQLKRLAVQLRMEGVERQMICLRLAVERLRIY
jgi:hypothetical protein